MLGADRRGFIRYEIKAPGTIALEGDIHGSLKAELLDISFEGISVFTNERLEVGSVLQFDFATGLLGAPLSGKGRITNIKEIRGRAGLRFKTGIEFIDMEKNYILEYLNVIQEGIAAEKKKAWEASNIRFRR